MITFGQFGMFEVDIGSSTYDSLLLINATIDKRAKISLSSIADANSVVGQELTLIDNRGVPGFGGTFANLTDGALVSVGNRTYRADYEECDGNDLTLTTVVPEPSALAAIAVAVAFIGRRRSYPIASVASSH